MCKVNINSIKEYFSKTLIMFEGYFKAEQAKLSSTLNLILKFSRF